MWDGPEDPMLFLRGLVTRSIAIQTWVGRAEGGRLLDETLDLSELFHPDTFLTPCVSRQPGKGGWGKSFKLHVLDIFPLCCFLFFPVCSGVSGFDIRLIFMLSFPSHIVHALPSPPSLSTSFCLPHTSLLPQPIQVCVHHFPIAVLDYPHLLSTLWVSVSFPSILLSFIRDLSTF